MTIKIDKAMKTITKLALMLALLAIGLAGIPAKASASQATTPGTLFHAQISSVEMISDLPLVFRVSGTRVCTQTLPEVAMSGYAITVHIWDGPGAGGNCDGIGLGYPYTVDVIVASQALPLGHYTALFNVSASGRAAYTLEFTLPSAMVEPPQTKTPIPEPTATTNPPTRTPVPPEPTVTTNPPTRTPVPPEPTDTTNPPTRTPVPPEPGKDRKRSSVREVYQQHASVSKVKVLSTGPGAATIRVVGSYTCDKIRTHTSVSGKTIYIEVWDVKNKGNDCDNRNSYTRDLPFKFLVPGKYTVLVNLHPKTGQAQRKIKTLIIPVYPATPAPATAP